MTSTRSIAARLTPAGRGAVATIGLRGDARAIDESPPLFRAANGRPLAQQPVDRVAFGRWGNEAGEEVVVCRTSPEALEICCHGGDAAVRRILADLESRGTKVVAAREFVAEASGEFDAECEDALSRATTARTAAILVEQRAVLRAATEAILADRAIDPAPRLDEILSWAEFGRRLTEPWRIVLAGRPNAGKSSLLNALVGYTRSIVFAEPGTTRDVVTADTAFDGWPLRFVDTAGLRDEAEELEAEGIRRTRNEIKTADLVLQVIDINDPSSSGSPPSEGGAGGGVALETTDPQSRAVATEDVNPTDPRPPSTQGAQSCTLGASLVVAHKSDLPDRWLDRLPAGALRASSKTGEGIDSLLRAITNMLVPRVPPTGAAVPLTPRQAQLLEEARTVAAAGNRDECRRRLAELLGQSSESLQSE